MIGHQARLLGLALAVAISGCTSMSSLQTARTVGEGKYRFLLGAGLFRTPYLTPDATNRTSYPFVEGGARYGFLEHWDLGVRYTVPGTVTGDLKYCFWDRSGFAAAVGVGVGYLAIEGRQDETNSNVFQNELIDVILPLFVSYDFSPGWGVYVSPRAVLRYSEVDQKLVGVAAGVRMGNQVGVFLEVGHALDLTSEYNQTQFNLGFFFGSANSALEPSIADAPHDAQTPTEPPE